MNKKILSTAIATALGLSLTSTASMALVDLNSTTSTPAVFASELDIDTNGNLLTTTAAENLNAKVELGFGFSSSNSDIFVRFDLDNGATWATQLTTENLEVNASASISLSASGSATSNYVIFNVTGTSNTGLGQDTVITLDLHDSDAGGGPDQSGVTVINKSPVNLTYGLYTTPTDAINKTNALGATKTGRLLEFASMFTLSGTTTTAVAEVTDDFKLFSSTTASTSATNRELAKIGTLTYGTSGTVLNADVVTATASEVLDSTATLVITGDFAPAEDIFLGNDDCSLGTSADTADTIDRTAGTATWDVGTNVGTSSTYSVCYEADTANPMSTNTYTAAFETFSDIEVGAIRRNGVELQAPFITLATGYVPRFYLTNTSAQAVDFSVEVQTDGASGQACVLKAPFSDCANNTTTTWAGGTGCAIPADSSLLIKGDDLLASAKRCTVVFRAAADDQDVHGLYQQRYQVTGDFDSYLMISIGSDSGH